MDHKNIDKSVLIGTTSMIVCQMIGAGLVERDKVIPTIREVFKTLEDLCEPPSADKNSKE